MRDKKHFIIILIYVNILVDYTVDKKMIVKNIIFNLCLFVVLLLEISEGCRISTEGYSFAFDENTDVSFNNMTMLECEQTCRESSKCLAFTYTQSAPLNYCLNFYNKLGSVLPCSGSCTTTTITRILPDLACEGNNQDQIEQLVTSSSTKCLDACIDEAECKHFLFFNKNGLFPNYCFLYSNPCHTTLPCDNCESGDLFCLPDPIYPSSSTTSDTTTSTTTEVTTTSTTTEVTTVVTTSPIFPP